MTIREPRASAHRRPTAVSQVLKRIEAEIETHAPLPRQSRSSPRCLIAPERVTFGASGEYTLRIANTAEDRRRAWKLVYEVYLAEGYVQPNALGLWYGFHDALPETVTFLVEREGRAVAAMTLLFDSPAGLAADELCQKELAPLRAEGRRISQIINLASTEHSVTSVILMKHVFKFAYLTARYRGKSTDLVLTVNSRHTSFYDRILLFNRLSVEIAHPKVDATVVLYHLDLQTSTEKYHSHYAHLPGERNLSRFFLEQAQELSEWVARNQRGLDRESLQHFFRESRPLLTEAQVEEYAVGSDPMHAVQPNESGYFKPAEAAHV